jgi:hypothetical protein
MIDSNTLPDPDCICTSSGNGTPLPDEGKLPTDTDQDAIGPASLRALPWSTASRLREDQLAVAGHVTALRRIPSPGIKFVHGIPMPLRHIGCMWLENGDEDCRCGQPAAWIMGTDLSLARLYCEEHGRVLYVRRCSESQERRRRKLRLQDRRQAV